MEPARYCGRKQGVFVEVVVRPMRLSGKLVLAACVFLAVAGKLLAQNREWEPAAAAEYAKTPKELLPNHKIGIDIDRFIGSSLQSSVGKSHGTILIRPILTSGNPYGPGEPGAVLEYRKVIAAATLLEHNETPLVEIPEQTLLFVADGQGWLDDAKGFWPIKKRTAVLIPPGTPHRLSNKSDIPLRMIMVKWTPAEGASPAKEILVRDLNELPFGACGDDECHWSYMGKEVFMGTAHGLSPREGFFFVSVPPMSMGAPHAHVPQWEEAWIKLPPHDSYMMLGSELRAMPPYTAFLAPPNYETTHAVINTSENQVQTWLLTARFIVDIPTTHSVPKLGLVDPKPLRFEQRSAQAEALEK